MSTAIPTAQVGKHQKKALLIISDGNDTNSSIPVSSLRQQIRESEVLVYALGIDGSGRRAADVVRPPVNSRCRCRSPSRGAEAAAQSAANSRAVVMVVEAAGRAPGDRVNADALRQITDDTGGGLRSSAALRDWARRRRESPTN